MLSHGWFVLGGFVVGCLFVSLTLRLFSYRPYRRVERLTTLAEQRNLESIDVSNWLNTVRIKRNSSARKKPQGYSLQAPAVRGKGMIAEPVSMEDGKLLYYFPENNPAYPEGIQFPAEVTWIFGNPISVRMHLDVVPAIAPCAGTWYAAIVHKSTGLAHPRSDCPKRNFWEHGYRNQFIGDFVAKGDPIGVIYVPGRLRTNTQIVYAPTSGFVLQFSAQQFTPVAENAIVMFLGVPREMHELAYQGDYTGYFEQPKDSPANLVGKVVEANDLLGTVSALGRTFQEPIVAPVRMRIVRQHVIYESAVQYKQALFTYIPV